MNSKGTNGYKESCHHCGMTVNPDDPEFPRGGRPDPCIGVLPGVIHACCGHGNDASAYVVFSPDPPGSDYSAANIVAHLRGQEAIEYFESVRPIC